jgi:hypothetical protein
MPHTATLDINASILLLACPGDAPQPFGSGQGGLSHGQAADTGRVLLIFVPRAAQSHNQVSGKPPVREGCQISGIDVDQAINLAWLA